MYENNSYFERNVTSLRSHPLMEFISGSEFILDSVIFAQSLKHSLTCRKPNASSNIALINELVTDWSETVINTSMSFEW